MLYLVITILILYGLYFRIVLSRTGIDIVMGKTGVGKSTLLAWIAKRYLNKGIPVWSNVDIKGCYRFSPRDDLMKFLIEGGAVIIDESGRDFNARNFKNFTDDLYDFFTLHRHYRLHVILSVQFWDRLDIVIRELIHRIYIVQPCLFQKYLIKVKEVSCNIDIIEGEIKQLFSYVPFFFGGTKYINRRYAWDMFDSFEKVKLPEKHWDKWSEYISKETWFTKVKKLLKSIKLRKDKAVPEEIPLDFDSLTLKQKADMLYGVQDDYARKEVE